MNTDANSSPSVTGGVGLYARVSSHDQKADLECQTARLSAWAVKAAHRVVRIESEIASGMNGGRAKAKRLLADPKVTCVVVEHKDRLGRMNVELVEAALSATGRRLVVFSGRRGRGRPGPRHGGGADLVLCPPVRASVGEEPGREDPSSGGRR